MSYRLVRGDPPGSAEAKVYVEHPELKARVWFVGPADGSGDWDVESYQRPGGIHVFDWPHYVRMSPEEQRGREVAAVALRELGFSDNPSWAEILGAAEDSLKEGKGQ